MYFFCGSEYAKGETCSCCQQPAAHKIGEEILPDDPFQARHNYTAYVCCECFTKILGPATAHVPVTKQNTRAPVQGEHKTASSMPPGTVSWEEHLEAYAVYVKTHGNAQSAERLAERAGFGYQEITELLGHKPKTWKAR